MTNQELDERVARARGWKDEGPYGGYWILEDGDSIHKTRYTPTTSPAQAMELLKEMPEAELIHRNAGNWACGHRDIDYMIAADTLERAICLAYCERMEGRV